MVRMQSGLRMWLGAALACGVAAGAPGGARGEAEAVLAPAVEVSVEGGGSVGFELRAMFTERPGLLGGGARGETEFVLVGRPRFGAVAALRQLPRAGDRDSATAVYEHSADAGGLIDEAVFEIREAGDGKALGSVRVTVRILRALLSVEPKGRLWLGDCAAGDSVEGVLTIENGGGAPLSFQVAAWRPFFVEDAGRQIYLAPGARVPLRYRFQPEAAGFFETPLILKPDLIRDYTIEAKAVEAVTIETNHLAFGAGRVGEVVRLPARVRNRARTARDVEVRVSGPFFAKPERMRVPPGEWAEIDVCFRPVAAGEATGWLVLREGATVERCQLAGVAHVGPDLAISPGPFISMGVVTGLVSSLATRLSLTNRGDIAWEGVAIGDGTFFAAGEPVMVAPGAMRSVDVLYRPRAFGTHTGVVTLAGPTTAGVTLAAISVIPSAAKAIPPSPPAEVVSETAQSLHIKSAPIAVGGGAVPSAKEESPAREGAAVGAAEWFADFDLDPLPVFEPRNFRASVLGNRAVLVEWDAIPELPPERIDFFERQFRPVPGGRSRFVWSRRTEVPLLSPDGRTASLTPKGLSGGWKYEFALAETTSDGKPIRRTPIIEVETGHPRRERRVPWGWIILGACALFVALHFVSAKFRK